MKRKPLMAFKSLCFGHFLTFCKTQLILIFLIPGSLALTANEPDKTQTIVSMQQPITVTGTIEDENGEPMPGVFIIEKGVEKGTTTDADGNYSITVSSAEAVLVFSYVGCNTEEIIVGTQSQISISLLPDLFSLDEIVVVGYGTAKRSDVTGAMVSVTSKDLTKTPVTNTLQALQGKAAGVDITSNERPGEVGKILIRGSRSLNASNDPLYVVDGIPLFNETSTTSAGTAGLETINPNDIESVEILKDASATAIYGSRGANGVILVTTKKGKEGALSLNYDGKLSIERMYDRIEMMNSAQYIEFRRDAYRRIGGYPDVPTYDDDQAIFGGDEYAWANIAKGWEGGVWNGNNVPTTDWTGKVLKTGITHEHTLSASGGTEKMKAYASMGYLKQDGTQLGQDFERYNASLSIELNPVKWFKLGGNINSTYSDQNYGFESSSVTGAKNLYFAAQGMLPYAVPFDNEGNRIDLPGNDINIVNPIGEDKYCINERFVLRALGSFYAEIKFMEGLKYRMNFGPDFYNKNNGIFRDAMSMNQGGGVEGSVNYAQYSTDNRRSWTLDNLLYYDKSFDQHNIGITLLQTSSAYHKERSMLEASNLPWNYQLWYQLNSVGELDGYSSGLIEKALTSYMVRTNYGFSDKYLFTGSIRWDGASQLSEGHKWDAFPSAAVAWRMSEENFMSNISWIDQLKLRLGVGTTGNAAVTEYETKGAITQLYYTWGSVVDGGYVSSDASLKEPNKMANEDLGWEHTTQWNLGLDFGFFRNRIYGTLDAYTSKTTDLLMVMSILPLTGYTSTWANVGSTGNKGIDLTINTINVKRSDFTWLTSLTLSANKDKIIELASGKEDDISNKWFIGERLNVFYDFDKKGIWQIPDSTEAALYGAEPGDIRVADLNGDTLIDANDDKKIRGYKNPTLTAGLSNTFTYKNWELSFFIYSRFGFTLETGAESLQGRYAQRVVNYWTPNNPTNEYPSPDYNSAAGDAYKSSMNYQSGSFIKLRNVSIGYILPSKVTERMHLKSMKVYGQLMNAGLLYSGCDWIDPDLGGSTFNRSLVFGVNVGF